MEIEKTVETSFIVWPQDENFEAVRVGRVFNHRRPARYPVAIVKASSEEDVKSAIKTAKRLNCRVSVRSGGHSWAAWSVRDKAVLIDLAGFDSMSFDDTTGILRVGPAVTGEKLNSFLASKQRMFSGPHCPTVGLGGFLYVLPAVMTKCRLQGGLGWNSRGWGWAAEQIMGIDVVTAEGSSVHCSKDINPDLFWAARGSGPGFFAVATQFHLQTRPLISGILASTYVWDISEYDIVMPWIIETSRIANRDIEIVALAVYPEPTQPVSTQRIQLVVHVLTFNASIAEARTSLALFATTVPLRGKALAVIEYEDASIAKELMQEAKAFPEKHRYCVDNAWIHSYLPTDLVVEAMRDVFTTLPSAESNAMYFSMAPEPPMSEMALSLQTEHWLCATCAWTDPKDDAECQSWLRSRFKDIDKVSPGLYVGDSDFQVRRAPFLAPGKKERLESVRNTWDPQSLFCSYLGLENE